VLAVVHREDLPATSKNEVDMVVHEDPGVDKADANGGRP
jgi:hypothetical protein